MQTRLIVESGRRRMGIGEWVGPILLPLVFLPVQSLVLANFRVPDMLQRIYVVGGLQWRSTLLLVPAGERSAQSGVSQEQCKLVSPEHPT